MHLSYLCKKHEGLNRWLFIIGLFLGSWTAVSLSAQSLTGCHCLIRGVVKNRETQQPVVGALLTVSGTKKIATTDAEGRYKIEQLCQGKYVLECRIVGYKTTKTTISLEHSAREHQSQ